MARQRFTDPLLHHFEHRPLRPSVHYDVHLLLFPPAKFWRPWPLFHLNDSLILMTTSRVDQLCQLSFRLVLLNRSSLALPPLCFYLDSDFPPPDLVPYPPFY